MLLVRDHNNATRWIGRCGVNEQEVPRPTDQHHTRIASVQLRLMLLLLLLLLMMMIQYNPCQWNIRRPYIQNTWIYAYCCCCIYAAASAPAVVGHSMQEWRKRHRIITRNAVIKFHNKSWASFGCQMISRWPSAESMKFYMHFHLRVHETRYSWLLQASEQCVLRSFSGLYSYTGY